MPTKTKKVDCVRIKNEAQRALREEYERRRAEFDTYEAFLDAKAEESPWVRRMHAKFGAKA
jgi:hypothetical protein